MTRPFDRKRWEVEMGVRAIERDERRKARVRERRRVIRLAAAGAVSREEIDRVLPPLNRYGRV